MPSEANSALNADAVSKLVLKLELRPGLKSGKSGRMVGQRGINLELWLDSIVAGKRISLVSVDKALWTAR